MHELIETLKNNGLHLDCPRMVLTQEGTVTPEIITGPGIIRQDPEGHLVFKLFSSQAVSAYEFADPFNSLTLGQLLPPTHYYSLRATDNHGREWNSQRIHADVHTGHIEDGRQAVIGSGPLHDIEYLHKRAGQASGQELSISFFENIDLPYNSGTVTEKSVAGKPISQSFCRNVALFQAAGFDCHVTMEDGTTTFVVRTDGQLSPQMDMRVVEAFQFILAKTVWPRVIRTYDSGSEVIRFTSALKASGQPGMNPPIEGSTLEGHSWTWVLFDSYLTYILSFAGEGWHPCSRHLHAVSKASANSIHSEALALGVAVEGICNEVFGHLCEATTDFRSTVKSLQQYTKAWPGQGNSEDTAMVHKRLPGMIGMLTQPRAIDRMNLLADRGWIDKDLIAAWQELRNKSAHGSTPDARVSQKFLDRCQQVTDLLYQLIYCAIGYQGMYIIRTPRAWRPREYPSRQFWASRVDEIRLTAYYRWLNRGALHGKDLDDWLAAEREILDAEWRRVRPNYVPQLIR